MSFSTDTEHTIRQLKRWFATFGVARSIRCDNGSPFHGREPKEFCDEYKIRLDLITRYNPDSLGASECGVGLIKIFMRKTEEEGLDMEEALAVFRNTRNESGYSPNQLFFLHNCAPVLPWMPLYAAKRCLGTSRAAVGPTQGIQMTIVVTVGSL